MKKRVYYGKGNGSVKADKMYMGAVSTNAQITSEMLTKLQLNLAQYQAENPGVPLDICFFKSGAITVTRRTTKAEREA